MEKMDYKKAYKELYEPKRTPELVRVPAMRLIMVDGKGDPNQAGGEYGQAVSLLYALSFTIKMSKLGGSAPEGYFEYVVPPLEGLWWNEDGDCAAFRDKSKFCWTAMIRQPEFVTDQVFSWACAEAARKKNIDTSKVRFATWEEGLCVQCMHLGPFDDEPATLERMHAYLSENCLAEDHSETRKHHEIYLSDPRKTAARRMKTVLRIPVKERD